MAWVQIQISARPKRKTESEENLEPQDQDQDYPINIRASARRASQLLAGSSKLKLTERSLALPEVSDGAVLAREAREPGGTRALLHRGHGLRGRDREHGGVHDLLGRVEDDLVQPAKGEIRWGFVPNLDL